MRTKMGTVLLAAAAVGSAAFWSGATFAGGQDDINPIFAGMTELPRAALERASGRGAVDESTEGAVQSALVSIAGATFEPVEGGESGAAVQMVLPEVACGACSNDLGRAFTGASAVAAITQNNGSNNAINNLVLVDVHMHP